MSRRDQGLMCSEVGWSLNASDVSREVRTLRGLIALMLVSFLLCSSSCRDSEPDSSVAFRISRGGYSVTTGTFLFAFSYDLGEPLKGSALATYHKGTGMIQPLTHAFDLGPVGFAWVPGRDAFVVTHGEHISFFERDGSGDGYSGRALPCRLGVAYNSCSWSPDGRRLAVACFDLDDPAPGLKLGVYDREEERFVLSDIVMKSRHPLWKDDATVLLMYRDEVVEVSVDSGQPEITATVAIEPGADWFYGVFDGEALVLKGREIRLGGRTLVECSHSRISSVATTEALMFVAASAANVVAFDRQGREVSRTDPGRLLRLGPSGEDPNTVYGLAGNILVRVSLEDGQLSVRDVCDLQKSMGSM